MYQKVEITCKILFPSMSPKLKWRDCNKQYKQNGRMNFHRMWMKQKGATISGLLMCLIFKIMFPLHGLAMTRITMREEKFPGVI